jgi:putative ABC transport system ATP-binding protein
MEMKPKREEEQLKAAVRPAERERSQNTAAQALEVTKVYGSGTTAVKALRGVTVSFPASTYTAIMGPSGSGKSTLLNCLAGLDDVTSGKIYVGETDVTELDEKDRTLLRRDNIGFIFQSYNLVPTLSAAENITLPASLARRDPDDSWVDTVVDVVGLRDRLSHRPAELSGGEQQRVAAARALAGKPDIVFADEPTGNLDSRRGAEILDFMRRAVREFHQTIVMVTHDPIAASYADRVVFLADGLIVDEMRGPTVERVLDSMKTLEA